MNRDYSFENNYFFSHHEEEPDAILLDDEADGTIYCSDALVGCHDDNNQNSSVFLMKSPERDVQLNENRTRQQDRDALETTAVSSLKMIVKDVGANDTECGGNDPSASK